MAARTKCYRFVTGVLPFLLPFICLIINSVTDVTSFPRLYMFDEFSSALIRVVRGHLWVKKVT